jgi:hypothetical protein
VYGQLEAQLKGAATEAGRVRAREALRATHSRRGDMLAKADRAFKNLHKHLALLKGGLQEYQQQRALR